MNKLTYRRGTARRAMPVEILLTAAELHKKIPFGMFAISDPEGHSGSSELPLFGIR